MDSKMQLTNGTFSNNVSVDPDTNKQDEYGRTLLHLACFAEDEIKVESLLKSGADPNIQDSNLTTPTHWCAFRGNTTIMQQLINANALFDVTDHADLTPLHLAVLSKNVDMVKLILSKTTEQDREYYEKTESPLHVAAYCGYNEILQEIIDTKLFYLNGNDQNSITPLHLAVAGDYYRTSEILIKENASCYTSDKWNRLPIHFAAQNGNNQILDLILKEDSTIINHTDDNLNRPLFLATAYGHYDTVLMLLEKGASIHLGSGINTNYFILTTCITPNDFIIKNFDKLKHLPNALHWAIAFCKLEIVTKFFTNDLESDLDSDNNTPLHTACAFGRHDIVQFLLDNDVYLNAENDAKETPMNWAASHGYLPIVKLLVKKRADLKRSLIWACANGHLDIVKFLIEEGADHEEGDGDPEYRRTPILWAASCHQEHVMEYLLDIFPNLIQTIDLLHWCAEKELVSQVERLLNWGIDPNLLDMCYFRTPLHWASLAGNVRIAEMLLEYGALLNIIDTEQELPIHYAVEKQSIEMLLFLIDRGCDVNVEGNAHSFPYLLGKAISNGNFEMVKILVNSGADVNLCKTHYDLPLNLAVRHQHKQIEEYLLTQPVNKLSYLHTAACHKTTRELEQILKLTQVDVNAVDEEGDTPLFCTIENDRYRIAEFLIKNGANVHHKNKIGVTLLHHAVQWEAIECAKLLIKHGIDINAKCNNGNTPLITALWNQSKRMMDVLFEHNVNPEIANDQGETALFPAIRFAYNSEIFESLLSRKLNIHAKTNKNETLLHYAAENYVTSFINLLMDTDIDINSQTIDKVTPVSAALNLKHFDHVAILILNGADLSLDPNILKMIVDENQIKVFDMLINGGLNLNLIEIPETIQLHKELEERIEFYKKNPLSLVQLARIACRVSFGRKFQQVVLEASLPVELKYYLRYPHANKFNLFDDLFT